MMMDESIERARCEELAKSSSFYRKVYSEIEEVGWESLRRLGGDLTLFSFHILDNKGRTHILELQLDRDYPKCPPSLSSVCFSCVPFVWTFPDTLLSVSLSLYLGCAIHVYFRMVNDLKAEGCDAPVPKAFEQPSRILVCLGWYRQVSLCCWC